MSSYHPGTQLEYRLPAHWASGLINGDFSSFDNGPDDPNNCAETNDATRWWDAEEKQLGQPIDFIDCGDESYFSHGNDWTRLGCDTLDYVAVAR